MKLLKEYTEAELLALTQEEKNSMFLLECANRGVTLPSATPTYIAEPSKRKELAPDLMVYVIKKGYSGGTLYFKTEAEAQAVLELLTATAVHVDYNYHSNNSIYYENNKSDKYEVSSEMIYSSNKYTQFKEEISSYEKSMDNIKSSNQRRESILEEQQNVMIEIDNAIAEADRNVTQLNKFKKLFAEYKKMANNDQEIAVKFLLNAHFSDISDYDDEQLTAIGITKAEIAEYERTSAESTNTEE